MHKPIKVQYAGTRRSKDQIEQNLSMRQAREHGHKGADRKQDPPSCSLPSLSSIRLRANRSHLDVALRDVVVEVSNVPAKRFGRLKGPRTTEDISRRWRRLSAGPQPCCQRGLSRRPNEPEWCWEVPCQAHQA